MTFRTAALLAGWSLLASSAYSFAQEPEGSNAYRMHVAGRRNLSLTRAGTADLAPSDKEDAEAADERAMNDPSLQRGDIIATTQGFVVFVGRESEEHERTDFLPAPNPQYSPGKPVGTAR
jgi:hypothetical protein